MCKLPPDVSEKSLNTARKCHKSYPKKKNKVHGRQKHTVKYNKKYTLRSAKFNAGASGNYAVGISWYQKFLFYQDALTDYVIQNKFSGFLVPGQRFHAGHCFPADKIPKPPSLDIQRP